MSDIKSIDRNINLDLIRLVSCIAVVMIHTIHDESTTIGAILYQAPGFAVPCFFAASGYILLGRKSVIDYRYSIIKVCKIVRISALWNFILLLVQLGGDLTGIKSTHLSLAGYIIIFVKNFIKNFLQKGQLWHFWFLGALILLYALLPIATYFLFNNTNETKRQHRMIACWLICFTVSFGLQGISYIMRYPLQSHVPQTFRFWTWMQYFILGGLISFFQGKLYRKITLQKHALFLIAVSVITITARVLFGYHVFQIAYAEYFYDDCLTVLWVYLLFTFIMRIQISEPLKRIIQQLSPHVMGVYIVHPLIKTVCLDFVPVNGLPMMCLLFLFVCVFSFISSYVLYKTPWGKQLIAL